MFNKSNLLRFNQDGDPVIFDADTGITYTLLASWPMGQSKKDAISSHSMSDSVIVTHPADGPDIDRLRFDGPYATALWRFLESRATRLETKNGDGQPVKQFCEALYV